MVVGIPPTPGSNTIAKFWGSTFQFRDKSVGATHVVARVGSTAGRHKPVPYALFLSAAQ